MLWYATAGRAVGYIGEENNTALPRVDQELIEQLSDTACDLSYFVPANYTTSANNSKTEGTSTTYYFAACIVKRPQRTGVACPWLAASAWRCLGACPEAGCHPTENLGGLSCTYCSCRGY